MIYRVDPLTDRRWEGLVERHPNSSIFHTSGWLEALRRTYDYEPVVYTTSRPQEDLANGFVFCRLSSRLTGRRLVSLPFSDHCDPLWENGNSGADLFEELCRESASQHWRYAEIRPRMGSVDPRPWMESNQTYCVHTIDLSPPAEELFSGFHRDCTQKKIRRAERKKLVYHEGHSLRLLKMFYGLVLKTRKKHGIPPQPFAWFRNLAECMGPAMQVMLALAGEKPAAGIVSLRFRNVLVAKYLASDPTLHCLGVVQWLFWRAMRKAKTLGLQELDLGRSDWNNPGLITFKDRLGGKRFPVSYWRYPKSFAPSYLLTALGGPLAWAIGHVPASMGALAGRLLYRHVG